MAIDNHGHCPSCGSSLTGGNIWATGFGFAIDKGLEGHDAEAEADRYAEAYGATRDCGNWGRAIGIYDMNRDRTTAWLCPDCRHEWPRN